MVTYQINIPMSGWVREKIDDSADWQGNLANPTAVVEQDVPGGKRLIVVLEETRGGVEIREAEMWKWVEDSEMDAGGYWMPDRLVSARTIELIS
ncbi:MAG TPA: hypothetical protein VFT66_15565 [Roseiflexaceae bacterium]|nr:hypothetical protein [Roseiflexaceae bacterium]